MRVPSGEMVAFERLTTSASAWSENVAEAITMISASILRAGDFPVARYFFVRGILQSPPYSLNCIWKNSCSGSGRLNEFTSPYAGANGTEKYLFSGTPLAATSLGLEPL